MFRALLGQAFRGPLWRGAGSLWRRLSPPLPPTRSARTEPDESLDGAQSQLEVTTASPLSATAPDDQLEKWQQRFFAKQGARERRRRNASQQKEASEHRQAWLADGQMATAGGKTSEQLEFDFAPKNAASQMSDNTAVAEVMRTGEADGNDNCLTDTAASDEQAPKTSKPYQLPSLELLLCGDVTAEFDDVEVARTKQQIQETLDSFNIDADVGEAVRGPRVTLYQIHVARGVRVGAISAVAGNLAMALSAASLRILAPVPGEDYVGVEVPNREADIVRGGTFLAGHAWQNSRALLPVILGRDIQGGDVVLDLARAPHLLVAGATGSGKSVCLNSIILSLLYRFSPSELKLLLVDPKVVEMSPYRCLPHLIVPVITEVRLVPLALRWLTREMERRYRLLAKVGVRNLETFNQRPLPLGEAVLDDDGQPIPDKLPFMVLIIDELADIMLSGRVEIETGLARLAQMSRAVGIHVIVATQRPSVNVITGVIKANFPTRLAFQVASQIDSRTIIDGKGAESLLGAGDMLFRPPTAARLQRLQGTMITDAEIERVTQFCAAQGEAPKDFAALETATSREDEDGRMAEFGLEEENQAQSESLFRAAVEVVLQEQKASISYVQRRLRVGYNKAANLMEMMEKRGIVGPQIGTAPREILAETMEAALKDDDY